MEIRIRNTPKLSTCANTFLRNAQVAQRIEARILVLMVMIQTCWRWLIAPVFGMESPLAHIHYARVAINTIAILPTTSLASLHIPPLSPCKLTLT